MKFNKKNNDNNKKNFFIYFLLNILKNLIRKTLIFLFINNDTTVITRKSRTKLYRTVLKGIKNSNKKTPTGYNC